MAPLVRTGGSRHTGLAALPHRNIQYPLLTYQQIYLILHFLINSVTKIEIPHVPNSLAKKNTVEYMSLFQIFPPNKIAPIIKIM